MSRIAYHITGFAYAAGVRLWDNRNGPSRAVSATRPGPDHLLDTTERG